MRKLATPGPVEAMLSRSIQKAVAEKFPDAVIRKRHVTMGIMGDPDLYGSLPGGRHFEIEVKRPGGQATLLQLARLAEWAATGAITGVAHSVEEALKLLGENQAAAAPQQRTRRLTMGHCIRCSRGRLLDAGGVCGECRLDE